MSACASATPPLEDPPPVAPPTAAIAGGGVADAPFVAAPLQRPVARRRARGEGIRGEGGEDGAGEEPDGLHRSESVRRFGAAARECFMNPRGSPAIHDSVEPTDAHARAVPSPRGRERGAQAPEGRALTSTA